MTTAPDLPPPSDRAGTPRRRVAVIGAGVSGLTCAYALRESADVTLYEAEPRLGGHAHTHDVTDPDGRAHRIDSGFIVHNDRTYPVLRRLFAELGVATRPTEMSMSIHCRGCGLQYAGGRGTPGFVARPRQLVDRRYLGLLLQVRRFHGLANAFLDSPASGDQVGADVRFGDWLAARGFDDYFVEHYAVPVVACVWSTGHGRSLDYPARYLFEFLRHHGMLQVRGAPTWHTVVGGSATYVEAIAAQLPDVRVGAPVTGVRRVPAADGRPAGVVVRTGSGGDAADRAEHPDRTGDGERRGAADDGERFDAVVLATHADTALGLLDDPTRDERELLGAFGYTANDTLMHTDDSLLPPARGARASWNYSRTACGDSAERVVVSYWMDRLHGLDTATPHLVSLNATHEVDPSHHLARMSYTHPVYTPEAVAAQRRLPELTTETIAYAGAYHGWGFHEDGARSGVAAARALGATW